MKKKFLISGGGTGGHIFPALAIAKEIERRYPESMLLFVGASNRMEMDKVPAAGYKIKGLWISGFQRSLSLKNLLFPLKLLVSIIKSFYIVLSYRPDMVIGTGGFASGPVLWVAALLGVPCLIQEQNSYPGITNKLLASRVSRICVAYPNLERFFPKQKILMTGNPIRPEIEFGKYDKALALKSFGLSTSKKTVLIIGGSLGAKRINEVVFENRNWFKEQDCQLIWQTGKLYYEQYKSAVVDLGANGCVSAFITDMGAAYAAADVVVSRAGAIAISEICSLAKASILIPSPNVAEDHQKKNALALASNNAALLVEESNIDTELFKSLERLLGDEALVESVAQACNEMGAPRAAEKIVNTIEELIYA